MKKLLDKKIVVINVALLLLGILAGVIFLVFTSGVDKLIIKNEIVEFFDILEDNSVNFSNVLISFKNNLVYITIIAVASIIYIFTPLVLFINFYKGMLIGFLISSVIMTFKFKGVLYSILIIFPHHIIMALLIIIFSSIMLHFSYKLARGTYKNESINLKTFIKKVGILYLCALVICFVSSILEIYLCPIFLKLFI